MYIGVNVGFFCIAQGQPSKRARSVGEKKSSKKLLRKERRFDNHLTANFSIPSPPVTGYDIMFEV